MINDENTIVYHSNVGRTKHANNAVFDFQVRAVEEYVIRLPFSDVTDRKHWYPRSLVRLEMSICIYLKPSFKS